MTLGDYCIDHELPKPAPEAKAPRDERRTVSAVPAKDRRK
jgi:hypothetical protein